MPLPAISHCVRLCYASQLGSDDEVTSACFEPHTGTDQRVADRYLSVHWLEYLGRGSFPESLQRLREFLMSSTIPGERKPTTKGKLATLSCDQVTAESQAEVQIDIDFFHDPRIPNVATSIEVNESGVVQFGVAPAQAKQQTLQLDPHSALLTLPEAAAHQLAVQQYLASKVLYFEPGRPAPS